MSNEEVMATEELEEVENVTETETTQDETEFTGTSEQETDSAEPLAEENVEEKSENEETSVSEKEKTSEQKHGLPDEEHAQKRIVREAKEKALRDRIAKENYRKGLIDAIGGVNPYTGKEIKDDVDVEEYLLMNKLSKEGKDPVADYSEAQKETKRAETAKEAEAQNARSQLEEFMELYPNVDVSKLLSDVRFSKFAGKRVDKGEDLKTVYADYLSFTADVENEANKKAEVKAFNTAAKKKASPGSLASAADAKEISYEDMSDEAFEREIARAKRGELKKR